MFRDAKDLVELVLIGLIVYAIYWLWTHRPQLPQLPDPNLTTAELMANSGVLSKDAASLATVIDPLAVTPWWTNNDASYWW